MRIIDAHLHLFPPSPDTDAMAEKVGHKNSTDHLRQVYEEVGMVHGVVMGNRSLDPAYHNYPADLFHYCIGLDSALMGRGERPVPDLAERVEENLRRLAACLPPDRVQIRIPRIPGYNTEENIRKSLDKLKRMGFTRLEVFHYILQKS